MRRIEGWEVKLRELIEAHRFQPFRFGTNDCATMAARDYVIMLGETPKDFPSWRNASEADALLKEADIETRTTASIGKPVDGWKMARRGDIVLIPSAFQSFSEMALAVCVGTLLASPGQTAISFVPLSRGLKTWRIGD